MDHSLLHSNISQVKNRIASAADDINREADHIRLIAVSKTKPADAVRAAFHAGISDFGENYVSEAIDHRAVDRLAGRRRSIESLPIVGYVVELVRAGVRRSSRRRDRGCEDRGGS